MKKVVFAILFILFPVITQAQESRTDYNFLRLPMSAHAAALGGDNITIIEDDPTLIFHNPALISSVSDKSINLNYMTYMEGVKTASASFVRMAGEKATWGVSAQYMDYGTMKEMTPDNIQTGTFSAKDIMVGGTFAYTLTDKLAGGVTGKFITSAIGGYNSVAVGVDLGLNYYSPENELSISAVARNLGGQVKAFDDEFEKIPFDLQIGISKKLGNAPLGRTLRRPFCSWCRCDDNKQHLYCRRIQLSQSERNEGARGRRREQPRSRPVYRSRSATRTVQNANGIREISRIVNITAV